MNNVGILASKFRNAINSAISAGEFNDNFPFNHFPLGCCGEASDLLSHFLLENDVITHDVFGNYIYDSNKSFQHHAWLITDDDNIIIDITGDQFKDNPFFLKYDKKVYVGLEDDFHKLFEIESKNINENSASTKSSVSLPSELRELYNIIIKYI